MKLVEIQNELKAPKSQYNSFGKYYYRSCEDILEGLKPLLLKHKCYLIVTDEVVLIGNRFYVKATAKLFDCEKNEKIAEACGYAREEETKKGMDGSQVTGAASSYARKYALNGLLSIDDAKDADTNNYQQQTQYTQSKQAQSKQTQSKQQSEVIDQSILTPNELNIIMGNNNLIAKMNELLDGAKWKTASVEEKRRITIVIRKYMEIENENN